MPVAGLPPAGAGLPAVGLLLVAILWYASLGLQFGLFGLSRLSPVAERLADTRKIENLPTFDSSGFARFLQEGFFKKGVFAVGSIVLPGEGWLKKA
ncbi:MAG: hypothetical protein H7836_05745 [Magnetococcus sp. YQC-3]